MIMTTHVKDCIALGEAAGWSGKALQRLVIDPKSETMDGFKAVLREANEIRGLLKIAGPSMSALGCDIDGALQDFVFKAIPIETIRTDTINAMAEADEATSVDTAYKARASNGDPYKARAAEIDAHKDKRRG